MPRRFFALWFRHLTTDYCSIRRPALRDVAFVLAIPDHGRKVITAVSALAQEEGIQPGMTVADARVLYPSLEVFDDQPGRNDQLLHALALWCIRYTPFTAVQAPDSLLLDISGCAHLWGGERPYLKEIVTRLRSKGYDTRGAIADTAGAAWAIARYGRETPLIGVGEQTRALLSLPPDALRLDAPTLARLQKLGLYRVGDIAGMPRPALRRRFGDGLLLRIDQAFGTAEEFLEAVQPVEPYQERLPCLEPILTATGIQIALERLLKALCERLQREGKGLRTATLKGYRMDGKVIQVSIGTHRASNNEKHLFHLFTEKIPTLEPGEGIELFTLDAPKVEDATPGQKALWTGACDLDDPRLAELADRVTNKLGTIPIHRYLPDEHYWPERSIKAAAVLDEQPGAAWPLDRPRPIHLLAVPEHIEVAAPIPDYPPMHFRYKGRLHKVKRAEGPERIEQEWWIDGALHRDYYYVEDEEGCRYWLFRAGHYTGDHSEQWYIHGFFA